MHKKTLLILIIAGVTCVFLLPSPTASSQPSRAAVDAATSQVDRPFREEAEEKLAPKPEKPPEIEEEIAPPEVEGPKFFIKEITLDGCETIPASEFQPTVDKYENKDVSIEGLNVLAKEIEREYLRKGIIAACFIPPQDIKEGKVTLQVVEAKMGDLDIQDHAHYDKERVRYYWDIKPGEVLQYDKMSKSLQMMNKNPDRNVTATLHAGKRPETTDVRLDVETYFPIHGFATYDEEGQTSTGKERYGFGIRDNNTLFVDDTLLAGYTFGDDFRGWYIYHSVPITNFGTTIMYGYSDSRSNPKKQFEPFGIGSRTQNSSFYVHQDLYKKAEFLGELSFGMDANDKVTTTNEGTLTRDRLRILRLRSTLIHRYPQCITYMTPQVSQGINGLGARRHNQLSSRGSSNTFTKYNLTIRHRRLLPLDLQANLNFKGQITCEKLASQEQLALGGIDSVRGYPAQDFMADQGLNANFELLVPSTFFIPDSVTLPYAPQPLNKSITGVLFTDHAYGWRDGVIESEEKPETYMGSVGAGVRVRLYNQVLVRCEWGFPIGDKSITESKSPRFHIAVDFEDQIDREIQRIGAQMKEARNKQIAERLVNDELNTPGSPLKAQMDTYLRKAQEAEARGDLEEAKSYYTKIKTTTLSLQKQAENYVQDCMTQQKQLEEYNKKALQYYNENNIEKAKDLWQKVADSSEIQPLVLKL